VRSGCRCGLVTVVAVVVLAAGTHGRVAAAAGTPKAGRVVDLGTRAGFAQFAVDSAHGHVFVSEPQAGALAEFSAQGRLVRRFPGLPGAWGLVIGGRYLYVAAQSAGYVARVDLAASRPSAHVFVSGLRGPRWLGFAAGRLWIGTAPEATGGSTVVSVDPPSRRRRTFGGRFSGAEFASSPAAPDELWMAEAEVEPAPVHRYDISTRALRQKASNPGPWPGNLGEMALSADGSRLESAAALEGPLRELCSQTLKPDGITYPSHAFPSAVATSASGLLATALDEYNSPDLALYRVGARRPFWTATTGQGVQKDGLALSADGRRLYTAVDAPAAGGPTLLIETYLLPPAPYRRPRNPCPLPKRHG
jgi:hypothetical protein